MWHIETDASEMEGQMFDMTVEEHKVWSFFLFKLMVTQEMYDAHWFPSLPSFIEEVAAMLRQAEDSSPELIDANAKELALQVEEWLAER
jgi:hypothetical protein